MIKEPFRVLVCNVRYYDDVGINEYDMVEVKVLKNGGKPIPGNGMGSDA